MNTAIGMIVEYNPFHNGHLWHLTEAKRIAGAEFAIAIMSGNFLQRGEPAITDKWSRAAMAVNAGVDLVIELPTAFAVRSAQYFATGGIQLLSRLGVVSHICFGAESADLPALTAAAKALSAGATGNSLRQKLKTGRTYAAGLALALAETAGIEPGLIHSPNNILAIEYLRAIFNYAPRLVPLVIQRCSAAYHDTVITSTIASATAIRAAIAQNSLLPPGSSAWQALPAANAVQINALIAAGRAPVTCDAFSNIVLARLRSMHLGEVAALPDVSEGLHNKISDSARKASTLQELLSLVKSKRYPLTRLQRIMMHALLGTTKTTLAGFDQAGPLYARILAFNRKGRVLLRAIDSHGTIPVITKTTRFLTSKQRQSNDLTPLQAMLAYDIKATDLYVLGYPSCQGRAGGQDYQTSPYYLAN